MTTPRTSADEEKILEAIETLLTPAYQIGPCVAGHDIDHVKRMIKIAERIVKPEEVNLFLLKIAIWFHNLDRSAHFNSKSDEEVAEFIRKSLIDFGLAEEEIILIIDAVQKHSQLNEEDDSPILRDLKDADRLDIGAIGILRIGALRGQSLPIYVPEDFQERTRPTTEKALSSMLSDIDRCIEWEAMLRNPRTKKLKRRFAFLRKFLEEVKRELKELGVI